MMTARKKLEECKAEFELMQEVLGDKTEKVIVGDNSMTSCMVSKKIMEIDSKHSIMTKLKKKETVDKSDKTVKKETTRKACRASEVRWCWRQHHCNS